ncbi:MAG: enoyl-CoA hydratase [Acidimicrobiales bacterium]|nr:enoyl-CoA hydratase [Hyphomonadaceae bacterium]RZV42691.1 MAG: enoyl-CoA hydratase [Acidimicrobiales bacterium]
MSNKYCKVETRGRISLITINRPKVLNALTPAAHAELAAIFDDFEQDPEVWVAILTGSGDRAFCVGKDLKTKPGADDPTELPDTGAAGLTRRWTLNKPVIAAVNGLALGGGFEIALACDLIVASKSASFGLPEPKVGLAAYEGGLLRLPRLIGEKRAMDMILTSRRVSATEGKKLGFVNYVVKNDKVLTKALKLALIICEASPMSIRASKETVQKGLNEADLKHAVEAQKSYSSMVEMFASDDAKEGPLAFAEKRKPRWKGK